MQGGAARRISAAPQREAQKMLARMIAVAFAMMILAAFPVRAENPAGPFFAACEADEGARKLCALWVHGIAIGMEFSGTLCPRGPWSQVVAYAIVRGHLARMPESVGAAEATLIVPLALRSAWPCGSGPAAARPRW
jgi:hypothetical protein